MMKVSSPAIKSSNFQCLLLPTLFPATANLMCNVKPLSSPIRGKLGLHVPRTPWKTLNRASPLRTQQQLGVWEEPDGGSDSEYEDEKDGSELDENDMDFESDWEQDADSRSNIATTDSSSANDYEEDLVKEVELLLGPEERAILQDNATPNLDKISTGKWVPLHTLALAGQIPFIDRLLESGVHIDMVDKDGCTALHKAIFGKKEAVVSHLLRKGANPHVRDGDGATPLHYAVQVRAIQTVKLLIKYEVDVNVADDDGWTPLHIAMQSRNRDLGKILLAHGADRTRRNKVNRIKFYVVGDNGYSENSLITKDTDIACFRVLPIFFMRT
ncbi:hypothetical protein SAY87_021523 [Trapa incisa]|uniref:Ankyrin repeat domain-containing protein EMB506, chloroplastic n=1 Tax=Trapa incisa TaxID=236973 RepID=A0AAN7JTN3_9MYRT|nr:hypothetical protein SAY87_021523 [Trapa incisa]